MKWLHISDIHFNLKNYDTDTLREKLLFFLEKQNNIDFVLITGDIIFQYGNDVEDEDVVNFVKKIINACGCESDKVFICPGNHDVNRKDEDRNDLISSIRRKKLKITNVDENKLIKAGHERFKSIYKDIKGKKYSSFEVFDESKYRIISLDTCLLSKDNKDAGKISLQTSKFLSLKDQITADDKLNIAIMHHGIDFFDQNAAKSFQHWVEDHHVDIVFCGHSHQAGIRTYDETRSEIRQYTCGAALIDNYAIPSFYICNFNNDTWQVEICMYTYSKDNSEWEADNHHLRAFDYGENIYCVPRKYKKTKVGKEENQDYSIEQLLELQHNQLKTYNEKVFKIYGKKIRVTKTDVEEEFNVQKIFKSLIKIGVPIKKAFYVIEKVVLQITSVSYYDNNERNINTNDIKKCVYQQICNIPTDEEASGYDINEWSGKYARRYGHDNHRMCIHMSDGSVRQLSYDFILNTLLKDLIVKTTGSIDYYESTYRNELKYMAEEIIYFLQNCDLYEVKYESLLVFIKEIATQPPHPWLLTDKTIDHIIAYNETTLKKHLKKIKEKKQEEITILETIYHSTAIILGYCSMVIGFCESSPINILVQAINKMDKNKKIPVKKSELLQLKSDLKKCNVDWGSFKILINRIYNDMILRRNFESDSIVKDAFELGEIALKLVCLHKEGIGDKTDTIQNIASLFTVKEGFWVKGPLQDLEFCFWVIPNWSSEEIEKYGLKKQILIVVVDKNFEDRREDLLHYLNMKAENCSDIIFVKFDQTSFDKKEKDVFKQTIANQNIRCIFLGGKRLQMAKSGGLKEEILTIISSI